VKQRSQDNANQNLSISLSLKTDETSHRKI